MRKTGLNGYAYDFGIDHSAIKTDNILGIHKYNGKEQYKIMLRFIFKNVFLTAITFFSYNVLNVNSLECVLMIN